MKYPERKQYRTQNRQNAFEMLRVNIYSMPLFLIRSNTQS